MLSILLGRGFPQCSSFLSASILKSESIPPGAKAMAMEKVREIVAYLRDLKYTEALAVHVEASEGGKRIAIRTEDGTATFLIECAGFPNEGKFLIGNPSPTTEAGWPVPQVPSEARKMCEPAEAAAKATSFMRGFKAS
jgi:hypothetical protein